MLTDNISVSDRLINGSIGMVKHIDRRSKSLCSNLMTLKQAIEDRRLCGDLKEYVPITAKAKRFHLKKGRNTIIAEIKQLMLILGYAISVNNFQGSTRAYMKGDLN